MSETKGAAMSETAVERRLREIAAGDRADAELMNEPLFVIDADAIDAGREAMELWRDWCTAWGDPKAEHAVTQRARALLARCEGETR